MKLFSNSKPFSSARNIVIFAVFCSVIALIVIFGALTVVFHGFFNMDNVFGSKKNALVDYKFFSHNTRTNSTRRGFVSLGIELSKEEYISFSANSGDDIIISNFDTDEFKCLGGCYCGETETSRRVSKMFVGGIFLIIAATSPFLAIFYAKSKFLDECKSKFLNDCEDSSVRAYVETCEKEGYKPETDDDRDNNPNEKWIDMLCQGRCQQRQSLVDSEMIYKAEDFGCEKLQYHKIVSIQKKKVGMLWKPVQDVMFINDAIEKFKNEELSEYCAEQSLFDGSLSSLCEAPHVDEDDKDVKEKKLIVKKKKDDKVYCFKL